MKVSIKFYGNASSGEPRWYMQNRRTVTVRRTDMTVVISDFRDCANEPTKFKSLPMPCRRTRGIVALILNLRTRLCEWAVKGTDLFKPSGNTCSPIWANALWYLTKNRKYTLDTLHNHQLNLYFLNLHHLENVSGQRWTLCLICHFLKRWAVGEKLKTKSDVSFTDRNELEFFRQRFVWTSID